MAIVNVHYAKTNLSKLLLQVEAGEPVLIARAGRVVAKLSLATGEAAPSRIGFLAGRVRRVTSSSRDDVP